MERAHAEEATAEQAASLVPGSAPALPAALTPATALALQRTIGNQAVAQLAIARAPRTEPAPITPIVEGFDDVVTHLDAAQNYRMGALLLSQDIEGMDPTATMAQRAQELIEAAKNSAEWHMGPGGGENPIHEIFIEGVREGLDDIRQMRSDIQYAKDAPKREAIAKAAAEAERLVEEYRKLEPKLLDAARAAFRADDDSLKGLAEFLDKYGTAARHRPRHLRDVARHHRRADEGQEPRRAADRQACRGPLAKLNKGISAVNLALSMRGEAGKTELDKGINGIGFAAGAFSSLGTLFGASAHIGLYANLYLVPLTKACLEGVAKLGELMHEQNKTWVEAFGAPGNYYVEPGGEPMWQYMTSVMKAKSSSAVAEPSDEVAAYFFEHRAKLDVGVNATSSLSELPIEGMIGFRSVDKAKFKRWIYNNRHAVWAMLYGSMKTGKG